MIQFDVVLRELGSFGPAQWLIVSLLSFYNIVAGINSLATVFIAYVPEYRCNVPPLDNATVYPNLTETDILNYTTPYDAEKKEYNGCKRYGYNLSACNGDTNCVDVSSPTILCDKGYYYDRSLFTETAVTEFDWICDKKYLETLSTSLYYLGMMIGSILFANFSDAFGRKICTIVTFLGVFGCMLGLSFCRSIELYIALRMAIAMFSFGTTLGTYVYIMEIIGEKWRTFVGINYQIVFSFGFMILGGIAYNWRNWHEIMFVSTILTCPLFLIFALIVPESPRWLLTRNKDKQGIKVIRKMAKLNKVTLTEATWEEARKAGQLEKELSNNHSERKYSSIDLFRNRGTLIITLKVMFNWFVNSLVYYGVSLNAGALAGDLFVNNTLNGVFEIASYIFCILVMDRIGRRILLTFLLLLSGIGLLVSVIVNTYAGNDQGLITLGLVFAFAGKFGISGSFAVIYNLTSELYPTVIRGNGVGMGSFAARVGGIIAPYAISLQDYVEWLPNTIFGVFGIVAGILSMTFPETNGNGMMETIEEAEEFYAHGKVKEKKESFESSEVDGEFNPSFVSEQTSF